MPDLATSIDWRGGGWIVPAIHLYALVVLVLVVSVAVTHRSRLRELSRRLAAIADRIEGSPQGRLSIPLEQFTAMIIHLGDLVERRSAAELTPVLQFLRNEERTRNTSVVANLVNLTETMIELFPMLGIFGTVWGISGVSIGDVDSKRLLYLFGVATGTTLWALLYVIVFRIAYSAMVQAKITLLEEYRQRFGEFLGIIERRTLAADTAAPARSAGS